MTLVALDARAAEIPDALTSGAWPRSHSANSRRVREGAAVHRTRAFNISQGGLRIECHKELPVGAEVIVTIEGVAPIAGAVRWKDGNSYGVTFNRILPVTVLMEWLHARREASRAA